VRRDKDILVCSNGSGITQRVTVESEGLERTPI
jgi:hypothetical protein